MKIKNVDPKDSILLLDVADVSLMYHYACGWQIHTPLPILGNEEDPTTSPKESFLSTQSCKPLTKKKRHCCVFVMCGDLKSMWALFEFCSGISGKEQCPCCTIQRVDHYQKDGKIAW